MTSPPMPTPSVEYGLLSPIFIVFGIAVVGVLIEAFLPRRARYGAQVLLALGGLTAAIAAVIVVARQLDPPGRFAVLKALAVDGPTLLLQGAILLVALLAVFFFAERHKGDIAAAGPGAATATAHVPVGLDSFTPQASAVPDSAAEHEAERAGASQTEVFPLTMLAVGGMLVFPAANDLLTMFVALEVLSLPLYLLCGLARHRRLLSQEAAVKYFLLGAFSSAFFLYGVALLYGATDTLSLPGIAKALAADHSHSMALTGVALLSVGLLFKVGAVPFHSWIPDVYQGAPTPITGFMAAATKVAAFGALLRVVYVALPPLHDQWRPVLWAIAILTIAVGTVTAVTQTDVKRMLAYSSIAHVGFLLTGVIADNPVGSGGDDVLSGRLQLQHGGRVRGCQPDSQRTRRRRRHHRALGWSRPAVSRCRPAVFDVPAGFRRHPADQRIHQQVRGVLRGGQGRRGAVGHRRCHRQRGRRVLLRSGDRADVLHRVAR